MMILIHITDFLVSFFSLQPVYIMFDGQPSVGVIISPHPFFEFPHLADLSFPGKFDGKVSLLTAVEPRGHKLNLFRCLLIHILFSF